MAMTTMKLKVKKREQKQTVELQIMVRQQTNGGERMVESLRAWDYRVVRSGVVVQCCRQPFQRQLYLNFLGNGLAQAKCKRCQVEASKTPRRRQRVSNTTAFQDQTSRLNLCDRPVLPQYFAQLLSHHRGGGSQSAYPHNR